MVSPNTLRLQGKNEEGNDLHPAQSILVRQGRPNFMKIIQRQKKFMNCGNTRGKRRG